MKSQQLWGKATPDSKLPAQNASDYFVARQPVFTQTGNLWGYELLFRNSPHNDCPPIINPQEATAEVTIDGLSLAFSRSKPNLKALINVPEPMLESGNLEHLPKESCVLEILEDAHATPKVLETLRRLKSRGYTLALDDYTGQDSLDDFLPIVDLVKVEFLNTDHRERGAITRHLRTFNSITLLAEKVESFEDAQQATDLGYDLMQGYYFQKPVLFHGSKVPPTLTARVHALWLLSQDDIDKRDVKEFFIRSPQLAFRLLKFVNSAAFSPQTKIQNLDNALAHLGMLRIRHWLTAAIMADSARTDAKSELAFMGSARAVFMKSIAIMLRQPDPDNFFMAGLFSLLQPMYNVPIEKLIEDLALDDDVHTALISESGRIGNWLRVAEMLERGNFNEAITQISSLGVKDLQTVVKAHNEAMRWTRDTVQ